MPIAKTVVPMLAFAVASTAGATTYTLDFDDSSESCCFDDESPPDTDYLGSHGITFTTSMEVLDEGGGFGVSGYSSPNFLAWNTSITGSTVDLEFTDTVTRFTAGSGLQSGWFGHGPGLRCLCFSGVFGHREPRVRPRESRGQWGRNCLHRDLGGLFILGRSG